MTKLNGSIEAAVPASFADQEWREFIGRSVYDRFPEGYGDLRSALADLDADDGRVTFSEAGEGKVRVTVELDYSPHDPFEPGRDIARAQGELDRDLVKYRDFVLRRCDEQLCRSS